MTSILCGPKGLHSSKGNSQESSVNLTAEVWVQWGKVLVEALPMERKWQSYTVQHLCCMLIQLGVPWWCLPKAPGKMLQWPHFTDKEDSMFQTTGSPVQNGRSGPMAFLLDTLDRTVPILWTLRALEGPSHWSPEARSFVSFREPCQLAFIPPDGEKHMPLSAPVFAFSFQLCCGRRECAALKHVL